MVQMRLDGLPVIVPSGCEPRQWWADAIREFRDRVGRAEYPCYFGHATLARGEIYLTFVEDSVVPLAGTLVEFLDLTRRHLDRRLVMAAFLKPGAAEGAGGGSDAAADGSQKAYAERFWTILQRLHDLDSDDWPAGLPADPDHPQWEFSFHGVPMFVFAGAPSYRRRASRNLGAGLVLMFQPRNVFHGIEAETPRGARARKIIRDRLTGWDTVPPHPDLGAYGDPANREWAQYFVTDDGSRLYARCPLRTEPVPDTEERGE